MKSLLICFCLLATILASDFEQDFQDYKKKYNKIYSPYEEEDRKNIYRDSIKIVDYYNKMYEDKKISFTAKMNKYSDLDAGEFSMLSGLKHMTKQEYDAFMAKVDNATKTQLRGRKPPPYKNWSEENACAAIQDQGEKCGSCYTFATASVIESHNCIHNNDLYKLSEQQILDCSREYGNEGCAGGYMTSAYDYFIDKNRGTMLAQDYKYTERESQCNYDKDKAVLKLDRYRALPPGNEDLMKQAIGLIGPVATGIDSSQMSFQFYSGGIYDDPHCKTNENTHAIVLVGYGKANGTDYWIIRNSMGDSWGMNGYGLVKRGVNQCGIANMPSYPVVKKKLEASVKKYLTKLGLKI